MMPPLHSDGLFDLQVNGYAGVDFNDAALTAAQLDRALEAMLADGVTGCLPTLITATPGDLAARFAALDGAVQNSRLGPVMVPGYHLEGPFLNAAPGYCGCHPAQVMTDPDIALVAQLEQTLSRPILLITIAPERTNAMAAVRHWVAKGKVVAMGHSAADFACLAEAATAGLSLSTHLGNGLPQTLPKLNNTLLAQLAETRLTACLIADGIHVPRDALRALIALKGAENCVVVSDAVVAAAAPPGFYRFAGMQVERLPDGRVMNPSGEGLAGSALQLDQGVRNLVDWSIAPPERALAMAGTAARAAIAPALRAHHITMTPGQIAWDDAMQPTLAHMPQITPPWIGPCGSASSAAAPMARRY